MYEAATKSKNPVEIYCEKLGNLDRQTQAQIPSESKLKELYK